MVPKISMRVETKFMTISYKSIYRNIIKQSGLKKFK
jgi:hypothetical protein